MGDDQIAGGIGDDLITGGDGNDVIDGGTGSDTIFGGAGNDTITDYSDGVGDVIVAGAGDDTVVAAGNLGNNSEYYGGDGNDTFDVVGVVTVSGATVIDGFENLTMSRSSYISVTIIKANGLEKLNVMLGKAYVNDDDLLTYMTGNKTEAALALFEHPDDLVGER